MMKMSKIALGVAAASLALSAQAEIIAGGSLAGLGTHENDTPASGTGLVGVSAIAVIVPGDIHNALQTMQGFSAGCIGNRSKLCAPSLSSAELRGILNNSIPNTTVISTVNGGALNANYGDSTNYSGTLATKTAILHGRAGDNVEDALLAFTQAGACGAGAPLEAGNANVNAVDDAGVIANVAGGSTKALMGLVHATSLDGNEDVGFIKLDGAAPDLVALMSSNYNLVSNLHGGSLPSASVNAYGTTFDVSAAGPGVGVAYHNFVDAPVACAPLDTSSAINDANGGS